MTFPVGAHIGVLSSHGWWTPAVVIGVHEITGGLVVRGIPDPWKAEDYEAGGAHLEPPIMVLHETDTVRAAAECEFRRLCPTCAQHYWHEAGGECATCGGLATVPYDPFPRARKAA
ncbi:MAG TPA: hypothetical protein VH439_17495 [Gemmatimonadales bacterium]|jgi:hypothetical protein